MAALDEQRHNIRRIGTWEQDVEHDDERNSVEKAGRDVRRRAQQSLQGKEVRTVQEEVGVVRVEAVKVVLR
jgi:hypothetical protein